MGDPVIPDYPSRPKKARRGPPPSAKRRRDRSPRWWHSRLQWRLGPGSLAPLCMQLRAYLDAGFPITEAWQRMAQSTTHLRLRAICRGVSRDLAAGTGLRAALAPHDPPLPRFLTMMLAAAERAGTFSPVLRTLERHWRWLVEIKGEILRVVLYPLFVLLLGKLIFVARDFILRGIADNPQGQLALPREPLVAFGMIFLQYFWTVFAAVILAWWITTIMREVRTMRAVLDGIAVRLPLVGSLVKRYSVANFCRMSATLLDAGQHPSQVYRDAAASMGNIALERRLLAWQKFVDDGEPLSEALRRAEVLPFDILAVFETAEQTASAGDLLPRVADLATDQIRHELRALIRLITVLSPMLIALAFFGSVLLAFLPFGHLFAHVPLWDILIFLFLFLLFLV